MLCTDLSGSAIASPGTACVARCAAPGSLNNVSVDGLNDDRHRISQLADHVLERPCAHVRLCRVGENGVEAPRTVAEPTERVHYERDELRALVHRDLRILVHIRLLACCDGTMTVLAQVGGTQWVDDADVDQVLCVLQPHLHIRPTIVLIAEARRLGCCSAACHANVSDNEVTDEVVSRVDLLELPGSDGAAKPVLLVEQ